MPCHPHRKFEVAVLPTFRPDKALAIDQPAVFLPWLKKLEAASNTEVRNLASLLRRVAQTAPIFFRCTAVVLPIMVSSDAPASRVPRSKPQGFSPRRSTAYQSQPTRQERYATFLMLFLANLNVDKRWVMQLHLGCAAQRQHRGGEGAGTRYRLRRHRRLSPGTALSPFLDLLQRENALPKTVLYNSNPADNHVFATLAGSFQSCRRRIPGERAPQALRWGPPWWFLDQKQGIIDHLNCLVQHGSAFAIHRNDDRLTLLSLFPAARVLPANPV